MTADILPYLPSYCMKLDISLVPSLPSLPESS